MCTKRTAFETKVDTPDHRCSVFLIVLTTLHQRREGHEARSQHQARAAWLGL